MKSSSASWSGYPFPSNRAAKGETGVNARLKERT